MGTLLSVAKAGGADQGADCRIVGARAIPDCATCGDPELGTEAMSRKWRGGGDTGGRFRKRAWKTWTFGHSLCEGAGNALGEDDTPEIITGVIKCSAGVSGTPAQGCIQEREGKKASPETTGADEPKGESQTFSKER